MDRCPDTARHWDCLRWPEDFYDGAAPMVTPTRERCAVAHVHHRGAGNCRFGLRDVIRGILGPCRGGDEQAEVPGPWDAEPVGRGCWGIDGDCDGAGEPGNLPNLAGSRARFDRCEEPSAYRHGVASVHANCRGDRRPHPDNDPEDNVGTVPDDGLCLDYP
jgi:hypothetical protein